SFVVTPSPVAYFTPSLNWAAASPRSATSRNLTSSSCAGALFEAAADWAAWIDSKLAINVTTATPITAPGLYVRTGRIQQCRGTHGRAAGTAIRLLSARTRRHRHPAARFWLDLHQHGWRPHTTDP